MKSPLAELLKSGKEWLRSPSAEIGVAFRVNRLIWIEFV